MDGVGNPVGDVGRRHRAAGRVSGDPRDASLAQMDLHAPERAGVGRHIGVQAVEHAHHGGRRRRRLGQVQATRHRIGVVPQVYLDPPGLAVDLDRGGDRDAVRYAWERIVHAAAGGTAAGKRLDRRGHPPLAIVEPRARVFGERVPPELGAQLSQPSLTDAGATQQREIVPAPLLGHAHAHLAHPDDVLDVAAVALHAHAGKDQRAFLIHVARLRGIRGRSRVAAVSLVALRQYREPVLA